MRFAGAGFAFLAYDRPGSGESTGDWRAMTLQDRADEVAAAMDVLVTRPEVDPQHIWLLGGSQGGWVAPLVATRRDDVAGLPASGSRFQEARQVAGEPAATLAVDAYARIVRRLREGL